MIKTTTIKQKIRIPAPPDLVYHAYLDSKSHSEFTGSAAAIEPKMGSEFTAWDGYIIGRNLELEDGKRIVQEWSTTEWPEGYPPSRVEMLLKAVPGGTELTLIQTEVPEEQAGDYAEGWEDFYWEPMKKYFKEKVRI